MELTNEILEDIGYNRINNSMWRLENITIQNGHISTGDTLVEKILSTKKAYKVCVDGKYLDMITTQNELFDIEQDYLFETDY
jgi:hypothetical protein